MPPPGCMGVTAQHAPKPPEQTHTRAQPVYTNVEVHACTPPTCTDKHGCQHLDSCCHPPAAMRLGMHVHVGSHARISKVHTGHTQMKGLEMRELQQMRSQPLLAQVCSGASGCNSLNLSTEVVFTSGLNLSHFSPCPAAGFPLHLPALGPSDQWALAAPLAKSRGAL